MVAHVGDCTAVQFVDGALLGARRGTCTVSSESATAADAPPPSSSSSSSLLLVSGGVDGALRVWRFVDGVVVRTVTGLWRAPITSIDWEADSGVLLVASAEGTVVTLWSSASRAATAAGAPTRALAPRLTPPPWRAVATRLPIQAPIPAHAHVGWLRSSRRAVVFAATRGAEKQTNGGGAFRLHGHVRRRETLDSLGASDWSVVHLLERGCAPPRRRDAGVTPLSPLEASAASAHASFFCSSPASFRSLIARLGPKRERGLKRHLMRSTSLRPRATSRRSSRAR